MPTIQEVIQDKLSRFGVEMSPTGLSALLIDAEISGAVPYDKSQADAVKQALVLIIPELLASPDVEEGQFKRSYNPDSLRAYYASLCSQLGVENTLIPKPRITDRSNLW